MDILDKAKELGNLIAASEEMANLQAAEIALQCDGYAQELMEQYKQLQLEMVRASKNKEAKELLDLTRQKLIEKQQELNDYSVTKEFLEGKSAFDNLIKKVNNVITFAITGEEPCSSSNCSSCGGGCK